MLTYLKVYNKSKSEDCKMKIVHIAPNAPYNDYWGYQENLLPKYQKKLGHDVTLIITNKMHKDGNIVDIPCNDYMLNDGVRVIRKAYKHYRLSKITNFLTYIPVYELLEELKPDFIFYHGLISFSIFDVVKYKKRHSDCVVVEDNHLDYNIGNSADTLKLKIIRLWGRFINKHSIGYVAKVYGVTPWRKTYAEEYFKIPKSKTDVLIMGADDEKMNLDKRNDLRKKIRKKYNICNNDFLIVTGGKIDHKKNIDILMEACANLDNVKLIVFGSVSDDIKNRFEELSNHKNIIYIGWISADSVYEYFYAADLVFFPGQHSVLWEQACASKIPCVFKKWEGMDHVNNGGNSEFIQTATVEDIQNKINELHFTEKYNRMKGAAESEKTDIYLYSNIAKKSLEEYKQNAEI